MVRSYKAPKDTEQKPLRAYFEEEEIVKKKHHYYTDFHEIWVSGDRVDNLLKSLGRVNKKGVKKYTDEARFNKLCRFIMSSAKPLVDKMTGAEWEASMRSLFKKTFKEDWDNDGFDNSELEADATAMKVAT